MKYSEMTKFLNDNGIMVVQPMIASEVKAQTYRDISEEEFEKICANIYNIYLDDAINSDLDIWYLVDEELTKRGYKE